MTRTLGDVDAPGSQTQAIKFRKLTPSYLFGSLSSIYKWRIDGIWNGGCKRSPYFSVLIIKAQGPGNLWAVIGRCPLRTEPQCELLVLLRAGSDCTVRVWRTAKLSSRIQLDSHSLEYLREARNAAPWESICMALGSIPNTHMTPTESQSENTSTWWGVTLDPQRNVKRGFISWPHPALSGHHWIITPFS